MDGKHPSLKASLYHEDSYNDQDVINVGLPEEDSKFLLSFQSFVLPVHVRAQLI